MTYTPGKGGAVQVSVPPFLTAVFTLTCATGRSLTVYSDTARTASVSMPANVTGSELFYVAEDDDYTFSATVDGIECAVSGSTVGSFTSRISNDTTLSVGVDRETAELGNLGAGGIYAVLPSGSDDTTAIQAVLNSTTGDIALQPGATYKLTGTTGLLVDPTKQRLVGNGVTIDASGMSGSSTAVTFTGSAESFFLSPAYGGFEHINLKGPGLSSSVAGIKFVGTGSGNSFSALFSCVGSTISDFGIGVSEGSNAWAINVIGANIYNCGHAIDDTANTVNGGERMTYIGCTIHNNTLAMKLTSSFGDHYFFGCSFDFNTQLCQMTGPHTVELHGGHVEYQVSTTVPVALSGSLPLFKMYGGKWIQHAVSILTTALTNGTAVTALHVSGGLQAPVTSGDTIKVVAAALGFTVDTFTASANAAVGDTSISVTSHAPSNSYSTGALVFDSTQLPSYIVTNSAAAGQNYGAYFDKVPMSGLCTANNAFASGAPASPQCWVNPNLVDLSCVSAEGEPIAMPFALPGGTGVDGPVYQNASGVTVAASGTTTLFPGASVNNEVDVTTTSAFTLAWGSPPTYPNFLTQDFTVTVQNGSGGSLGTITWPASLKFAGFTWANPASGKRRCLRMQWQPNAQQWVVQSMSSADY